MEADSDRAVEREPDSISRPFALHDSGNGASCPLPGVPRVVVVGCAGHARVVLDIIETEKRCQIVGLIDTYKPAGTRILGYQILGRDEDLPDFIASGVCDAAIVAIGDNWVRSQIIKYIRQLVPDLRLITAIHPFSQIARDVLIDSGTVVMPGVVVNAGCRIGVGCILNTSASLDHDSIMGDYSSLAPRAVTGGNVSIGAYSAVSIGAVVSHATTIGDHTVVGAGALAVRDIPAGVVAYGIPARVIRKRNPGDAYLGERSYERPKVNPALKSDQVRDARMEIRLIGADSTEWDEYAKRGAHDFFHTAGYHRLTEDFGGGKAWLAVCGDGERFVAWPMIFHNLDNLHLDGSDALRDVTAVYGYTGPIACGCENNSSFLSAAWQAIRELWRSHHVVSAFTRFHPLFANYRYLPRLRDDRKQVEFVHDGYAEGATVAIDLTRSAEEIWRSYSRQLHQALRRLIRQGVTVSADPQWTYLDEFVRMYHSTMKRNSAGEFYFFSHRYFVQLREALGQHGTLMVASCGEELAAASLLIEYGGIVNVHLLATEDSYLPLSPSKLLIHQAQVWARSRGNRFLHLGGGRGSRTDDPLFRFKSQFSDKSYPFYTGRWVLNRPVYDGLVAQGVQQKASPAASEASEGFFPAYRAPL
jgi:sugar O-acyltransferase (sialic acid O-acetyltransferase NeuD family)